MHLPDNLVDTDFQGLNFPKLRILMLYPWAKDPEHVSDIQKARGLDEIPKSHLVRRSISHDLPELRVFAIREHRFWIAKESNSRAKEGTGPQTPDADRKIWILKQGKGDPSQAAEIRRSFDVRDWAFIEDIPLHPRVQDVYATSNQTKKDSSDEDTRTNILFRNYEGLQMLSHRNYLVLRPANVSAKGHGQSKDSSSPYGRPLHWLHTMSYLDRHKLSKDWSRAAKSVSLD